MNYIKMIKEAPLWNAGYCQLYDFSKANSCEEARIEAVCKVARVCRNEKIVKTDEKLYQQLLTEHNGKPGSVFEFVPALADFTNGHGAKFGTEIKVRLGSDYLTNLRANISDNEGDYNKTVYESNTTQNAHDFKDFFVFKVKVPQMIVKHILRHRMLSFQECSERTNKLREYYYCDEFEPILKLKQEQARLTTTNIPTWDDVCRHISIDELDRLQKQFKIPQEKLNKGEWGLRYTTLWISAWNQDPNGWDNFFAVRTKKPAQKEIIDLANVMKQMMGE